jgi:hypothetical protein
MLRQNRKPSGRKIPDQSDGRQADIAGTKLHHRPDNEEHHFYKRLQFQNNQAFKMFFFETTSGGVSAQVRHLHPFFPMHPIELAR